MDNNKKELIVFEGGEGSGKSSVIASLKNSGVFTTREPGGSPFSEKIRQCMLSSNETKAASETGLMLCMFGLRVDHLEKTILPALNVGKVVCDRFDGSTFAYQVNVKNESIFWNLREIITDYVNIRYIYLDLDPAIGLARKKDQGELLVFEDLSLEYHQQVRRKYLTFANQVPSKIDIVNANIPLNDLIQVCTKLVFNRQ